MSDAADAPTRILVVDDHDDVRFLIRSILLGAAGLEVVGEADSGEQALDRVAELEPHVLVLDAMMPGMDGLETARRVRAERPGAHVVLCSATVDPGVWRRARAAGVDACVSKDDFFSLPDVIRALAAPA